MKRKSGVAKGAYLVFMAVAVCYSTSGFAKQSWHEDPADISLSDYHVEALTFRSSVPGRAFVQVFCEFLIPTPSFFQPNGQACARYRVSIHLEQLESGVVQTQTLRDSVIYSYTADQHRFLPRALSSTSWKLEPGKYRAGLEILHENSEEPRYLEYNFAVPDYFTQDVLLSDIEIAANRTRFNGPFSEIPSRRSLSPHLSRVFGLQHRTVYVYSEIYNFKARPHESNMRYLTFEIWNSDEQPVARTKYSFSKKSGDCAVEASFEIGDLPTGTYLLEVDIDGLAIKRCSPLNIVNPFLDVSDLHYFDLIRQLGPVANRTELEHLVSLPQEERRNGLMAFWSSRDPFPETTLNEFLVAHFERIYFANQFFDELTSEGWQTDKGEVFVRHGEPDEIRRVRLDLNSKLYEIWSYQNLNQRFLFVDNWDLGNFQLIRALKLADPIFTLH